MKKGKEKRIVSETGGAKGSKPQRFDLIPVEPLWEVAELYGFGAEKYPAEDGIQNWTRGYPWSLSYAALQRHINLFWAGEEYDEETGLSHLSAVVFHALALRLFMDNYPEFDDRQFARFNKDAQKSKKSKKKGKKKK